MIFGTPNVLPSKIVSTQIFWGHRGDVADNRQCIEGKDVLCSMKCMGAILLKLANIDVENAWGAILRKMATFKEGR